jgi:hypothetical protein
MQLELCHAFRRIRRVKVLPARRAHKASLGITFVSFKNKGYVQEATAEDCFVSPKIAGVPELGFVPRSTTTIFFFPSPGLCTRSRTVPNSTSSRRKDYTCIYMSVMKMKKCPTCIGIGSCGEGDLCPTCEGTGEIPTDQVIIDDPCQPVVCLAKSPA